MDDENSMKLRRFPRILLEKSCTKKQQRCPCSSTKKLTDEEREKELDRIAKEATIDEPPNTCCMSGCANCVYIAWAEAVAAKMKDGGPEIAQRILKNIDDPSMKAYLELELKVRGIK